MGLRPKVDQTGVIPWQWGYVKLRGSQHSKDLRVDEITNEGLIVGKGLRG
jgi:hypothetical protein